MISVAFKMLIGNRASCLGVIFGIFLATLLISQQSAIFLGVIDRSYRIVNDIPNPNIWVVDPVTESEDKLRTLPISYVDVVRSVPGVEWAVPLGFAQIPIVTSQGKFEICQLYGIDDATLIGAPYKILEGSIQGLRQEGGVIVDINAAQDSLATTLPNGTKEPLKLGDSLEINGKRAVVVAICKVTQGFYLQPAIFTALSQFRMFNPKMGNRISYILAKTDPTADVGAVVKRINAHSGLRAWPRDAFKSRIRSFFFKTGILINFELSLVLGAVIGFSIAGLTFYIMNLQNVVYYALIKALGGTQRMILQMILFQAALLGAIGYALGIGVTILWGMAVKETTLAFLFPWQLLVFTGLIILIICVLTAALSIKKVLRADPKLLMGT